MCFGINGNYSILKTRTYQVDDPPGRRWELRAFYTTTSQLSCDFGLLEPLYTR